MQSNTPKGDSSQRERPLQKSMFLPQFQPQPIQSRPQPLENIHYNPLKRSSMPVLEGIHQSNLSPSYHSHNISYSQQAYIPPPTFQFTQMRAQSQHELLIPQNNNISSAKSLNFMRPDPIPSSNDIQIRGFSKFEKSLGLEVKSAQYGGDGVEGQQALINAIVEQVKEKHLPVLLKAIKKQLSDEIASIRSELVVLKTEVKLQNEKQEFFNNEIRSQTGNIINFNTNNINNISKIKKEEGDYKELEKGITALERKYSQIEVKLSENLTSLYNQFEKITQKLEKESKERGFKVSQVKCPLSPIMLEYKESFMVRKSQLLSRGSGEQQLVMGTCCYYIDRSGYLLDAEGKYLTDMRGHQIRLEDRHLKLLQQFKLLYR